MSQITLTLEELAALKRARLGYVRFDAGEWTIDHWAPLRIFRDSLSNIPAGAVRITFDRVAELGLVVVDDGVAALSGAGATALGTGVVSDE